MISVPVLHDGAEAIFLSAPTQQIFECKCDEDVTASRPYKLIKKEDIMKDLFNRAAVCDFHPFKKTIEVCMSSGNYLSTIEFSVIISLLHDGLITETRLFQLGPIFGLTSEWWLSLLGLVHKFSPSSPWHLHIPVHIAWLFGTQYCMSCIVWWQEFPEDEILVIYDADYKFGQNFIMATTVEAKENYLYVSSLDAHILMVILLIIGMRFLICTLCSNNELIF